MAVDRKADVILVEAGKTKDRKPLFAVRQVRNIPPVITSSGNTGSHGELRVVHDNHYILRPSAGDWRTEYASQFVH